MGPGLLADAVLVVHGLFIAWALLGGFVVVRWPWLAVLHLPALAWGLWIEASGGLCPLTPLENSLRRAAGETGYFMLEASVYERAGQPCRVCAAPIRRVVQGQRATYYCPRCQRR